VSRRDRHRPPSPDGVAASWFQLPPGDWATVLEALDACFPQVGRAVWSQRLEAGLVADAQGQALAVDARYRVGLELSYYRDRPDEPVLAPAEHILHHDERILVADKPHGLPVTPAGGAVRETLLARLVRRTGKAELVPLHRIDRDTAGLVLFSTDPGTRDAYQSLFRERRIAKTYQALAPPLPGLDWPQLRCSRIERGEPFFRMHEVAGEANSRTRIEVLGRGASVWRYRLQPVTGRKHQLRVHMAALGAPILGDRLYPVLQPGHEQPGGPVLQLLAASLDFIDPLDGSSRTFASRRVLDHPHAPAAAAAGEPGHRTSRSDDQAPRRAPARPGSRGGC